MSNLRIGVVVIATNSYTSFIGPLYDSMKKYFMLDKTIDVTMIVFTNQTIGIQGIREVRIDHEPWPMMTLKRFHVFYNNRELLREFDYLVYMDADTRFVDAVGSEVLGDLVVTNHAGFYGNHRRTFPYEKNPKSRAYISPKEGTNYVCGGFFLGRRDAFLNMAKSLMEAIDTDLSNNIIAMWHDESHLNRYIIDHPPSKILHPMYCYHEDRQFNYSPKILAITKNDKYAGEKIMENLTFIFIIKFDSFERQENFIRVLTYVTTNFPVSKILIAHEQTTPFHRTKYINRLLEKCSTPYAAVWDVDVILDPSQVRKAVELLKTSPLVYPYTFPWCNVPPSCKNMEITELLENTQKLADKNTFESVGGCFMVNVAEYLRYGGENENFIDWGPEDQERAYRIQKLTGKPLARVAGPLFHVWHPYTKETTGEQPFAKHNTDEYKRIRSFTTEQLISEVMTWKTRRGGKLMLYQDSSSIVTVPYIEDDSRSGRLGNKMFMTAAAIGLAKQMGCTYRMPKFKFTDIFSNINSGDIDLTSCVKYQEPSFNYVPIPVEKFVGHKWIGITGYYQSEKYFLNAENEVRHAFELPEGKTKTFVTSIWSELRHMFGGNARFTVIGVRRDDYLNSNGYHSILTPEYYKEAMNRLKDDTDVWLIYCDKSAEAWCKENIKADKPIMFPRADAYIGDIISMSNANNHIIANSTFHWWGAWLNNKPDKKVIAPKEWFGTIANIDDSDIIPETWTRI